LALSPSTGFGVPSYPTFEVGQVARADALEIAPQVEPAAVQRDHAHDAVEVEVEGVVERAVGIQAQQVGARGRGVDQVEVAAHDVLAVRLACDGEDVAGGDE